MPIRRTVGQTKKSIKQNITLCEFEAKLLLSQQANIKKAPALAGAFKEGMTYNLQFFRSFPVKSLNLPLAGKICSLSKNLGGLLRSMEAHGILCRNKV